MKTLKLLLAITIIATSLNTNAQEKQNDATWQETIEFLEKYKSSIGKVVFDDDGVVSISRRRSDRYNINFKEASYFLNLSHLKHYPWDHTPSKWFSRSTKIPWQYLYLIKKVEDNLYINIYFLESVGTLITRGNIEEDNQYYGAGKKSLSRVRLYIENNETKKRFYKALKHLAYLAKQQREAKRKASGDKF